MSIRGPGSTGPLPTAGRARYKVAASLNPTARIYVAGHGGLVRSAVVRHLQAEGFDNLLTATREQLDLRDQAR